ncbi:MAG: hypothetical protein JWR15_3801 [Prosthecobacter sp.]|nr:hypothetical protein [Prosthecobacter sp.]
MEELNPYAAPEAELLVKSAHAGRLRLEHLKTESHVKALGCVMAVLGPRLIVSEWYSMRLRFHDFGLQPGLEDVPSYDYVIASACLIAGGGLIRLMKWAGMVTFILSVIQITLNVPALPYSLVGIAVQGFILRFLYQERTYFVLSSAYQDILRQTPQIKNSTATWGLLVSIIVLASLLIPLWALFH